MTLMATFEVTTGSTAGRSHRTAPNLVNNQDVVCCATSDNLIVAALSDGCSSAPHPEFGAHLVVNTLTRLVRRVTTRGMDLGGQTAQSFLYKALVGRLLSGAIIQMDTGDDDLNLTDVMQMLDNEPDKLAAFIAGHQGLKEVLNTYMMATAGVVVVLPQMTHILGAGDFEIIVNGERTTWSQESRRQPLYPILSLSCPGDERFTFRHVSFPTADLETLLFATDGGGTLIDVCGDEDARFPGSNELIGPITQIWTDDKFYAGNPRLQHPTTGPQELDYWLNRLAHNVRLSGPALHGGLLDDDTTLFALRRKGL